MRGPARIATLSGRSRRFRFPIGRYEIAPDFSLFLAPMATSELFHFAFRLFCEIETATLRLVARMLGLGWPATFLPCDLQSSLAVFFRAIWRSKPILMAPVRD